jgi:hypothetical protein
MLILLGSHRVRYHNFSDLCLVVWYYNHIASCLGEADVIGTTNVLETRTSEDIVLNWSCTRLVQLYLGPSDRAKRIFDVCRDHARVSRLASPDS